MNVPTAHGAHGDLPFTAAAQRLATAAAALTRAGLDGADGPRVAAMAATAPAQWNQPMVESAAQTMQRHRNALIATGVDPDLLPRPDQQPSPHPVAPTPAAPEATAPGPASDPREPFTYDGSIDGLRGIPTSDLAAVTGKATERFTESGLSTVYDVLMHVPLRYVDRSQHAPIAALTVGETCTAIARVTASASDTTRNGQRLARITVTDDTGTLTATFFNSPWQAKRFAKGDEVVVQGRLEQWTSPDGRITRLSMVNPLMDKTGDEFSPIVPVYPQRGESTVSGAGTRKWKATLTTWQIHRAAMEAVARMGDLRDPVPQPTLTARKLLSRRDAYRLVHHPQEAGDETRARARLSYDELLRMQVALGVRRAAAESQPGVKHTPTGDLTGRLLGALPYPLTGAQSRAVSEIVADMRRDAPMNRLLQGDVGAGKTITAVLALLAAVESGHQAVLMAPTEILATQLYAEVESLIDGMVGVDGQPLSVGLMTNKVRSKARKATVAALADGSLSLIVGTHALLSDDVVFSRLGLVVVDEQHRFGVEQRAALRDKGNGASPDMLVMTATPIPRTAAMTVFGDLDVTVLDELPPGRTPIATEWIDEDLSLIDRDDATWALVREQVEQGRQCYVVCPLVEESETQSAANANDTATALRAGALSGLSVGVAHGKQKPDERSEVMDQYKAGDLDVLVATTVIEVGVNVPNASVIVILNPGQFGIAQLHQLRGRVGRGKHASTCVLAGEVKSGDGQRRMDALCSSTDGFVLSEKDLEIRGHGSLLGSSQAGLSDLRVASLDRDRDLLAAAREDAAALLDGDPTLARHPGLRAEVTNALGEDGADWLTRG